jgi:tyrosyl-tRNA synthetase
MPRKEIESGLGLLTAIVKAGLAKSNGEARRHVAGGGVRVNDDQVRDEKAQLTPDDLSSEGVIKLSVGKKRHVLIRPV